MAGPLETDARETIAHLIPQLTDEELSVAVEAFLAYVDFINDLYDALELAPERFAAACALTANPSRATVEMGRVEPTNQSITSLNA